MKIIDFHAHIFPDALAERALSALLQCAPGVAAHTDGTLAGLRTSMKKSGIDKSVLLPIATKPGQVPTINATCAGLTAEDTIPFGTLHPDTADIDAEIKKLKTIGVKGIKFHPEYQDFYIDDRRLFPVYELLQAERMIVVFHAGKDPGPFTCDHALPPAFATLMWNFPHLSMVAAHMGGWKVWDQVERLMVGKDIYFDTAAVRDFLPSGEFVRLARKHGTHRILFGSDSPWFDQGDDVTWIDSLELTRQEKDGIFYKNAEALLNR
jgi:uncharacterized protein